MWLIVASCAVVIAGERHHCGHRWRTSLSCGVPLLPSGLGWVLPPIVTTTAVGVGLHELAPVLAVSPLLGFR
jgi:hypothetical protein